MKCWWRLYVIWVPWSWRRTTVWSPRVKSLSSPVTSQPASLASGALGYSICQPLAWRSMKPASQLRIWWVIRSFPTLYKPGLDCSRPGQDSLCRSGPAPRPDPSHRIVPPLCSSRRNNEQSVSYDKPCLGLLGHDSAMVLRVSWRWLEQASRNVWQGSS